MIDAKAPGLKRPSEVLKKFLLCAVGMAKKPLGVARGTKEAMAFPSKKIGVPPKTKYKKQAPPRAHPLLLSTPGPPECHAVPQGTKCGANRAHGHVLD
jgi:hypothetical protein